MCGYLIMLAQVFKVRGTVEKIWLTLYVFPVANVQVAALFSGTVPVRFGWCRDFWTLTHDRHL